MLLIMFITVIMSVIIINVDCLPATTQQNNHITLLYPPGLQISHDDYCKRLFSFLHRKNQNAEDYELANDDDLKNYWKSMYDYNLVEKHGIDINKHINMTHLALLNIFATQKEGNFRIAKFCDDYFFEYFLDQEWYAARHMNYYYGNFRDYKNASDPGFFDDRIRNGTFTSVPVEICICREEPLLKYDSIYRDGSNLPQTCEEWTTDRSVWKCL